MAFRVVTCGPMAVAAVATTPRDLLERGVTGNTFPWPCMNFPPSAIIGSQTPS